VAEEGNKPGEPEPGEPKPAEPSAGKWQGEEDGKFALGGGGSQKGPEKNLPKEEKGWGNREVKPKEPAKPGAPPSREVSLGPVYKKTFLSGNSYTSKEGDDASYVSALEKKVSVEVGSASYDLEKAKAKATVVKISGKVTVLHEQVDLVQQIKDFFFGEDPKPLPNPDPPPPNAARVGDFTVHGSPLMPGPGSPNVMIGGMPAWRVGPDMHVCPFPGPPHGGGPTLEGARTVLINGFPAARAGDYVVEPTGGPDVITSGCPTVRIGPKAGPPKPSPPVENKTEDLPWVVFESVGVLDTLTASADANLGGEIGLVDEKGTVEVQAGAMAAVFKGELPLKVKLRVPYTTYYVGLGVKAEGTLLSAGAEAGAGVAINDGDKLFSSTAGAKVGAGLGGVGVKFSLDVAR
jgi:uncharacterized Zn-binding protein involved in type VI secretion